MTQSIDTHELQILWSSVKLLRQHIRDKHWATASGLAEAIKTYADYQSRDVRLENIAREALEDFHQALSARDKGDKRVY